MIELNGGGGVTLRRCRRLESSKGNSLECGIKTSVEKSRAVSMKKGRICRHQIARKVADITAKESSTKIRIDIHFYIRKEERGTGTLGPHNFRFLFGEF